METAEQVVIRVVLEAFPEGIHRHLGDWLQTGPMSINLPKLAERITDELARADYMTAVDEPEPHRRKEHRCT